ncbi:MAG: glutamate--cysteine ligase [Gemmatimonadota bacterium]|nr:glutamate--cysteine ligase [Gemmatimonadota bacterium]
MTSSPAGYTLGIEEEFQIVDPVTRELRAGIHHILPTAGASAAEVQAEIYQSMIETATPICRSLAEAREELVRLRRTVIAAAEEEGAQLGAAGTHPISHWTDQEITPHDRYQRTTQHFQQIGRELLIYGCHVHVGVPDREVALHVVNRARVWLAPLVALAANSPFWLARDTGYASFRTAVWSRFPTSGPPGVFSSYEEYEQLVLALAATGVVRDPTRLYWDLRIPVGKPTVEFRATDVCLTVDESVMVAGLCRALVRTAADAAERDEPVPFARHELLRCANWMAARYGVEGELVDLNAGGAPKPAAEIVGALLEYTRPALEAHGDWDEVSGLVAETLRRGSGTRRQREVYWRTGRLEDVVDYIVAETRRGVMD